MATIVVEDGTGLTNSNSYVSEAELTTYATDRGVTISGTNAVLLIQSMDYIESQDFKGYKYSEEQALQWPRGNVSIDGYLIDVDEIPTLLKEAQMETALSIDAGTNPMASVGRATKREKVDVIEVEYMDNAAESVYITAAETKLTKLVQAKTVVFRA